MSDLKTSSVIAAEIESREIASKAVEQDARHVWHHLTRHAGQESMVVVKGEGMRVWDAQGNEYLDAVSGAVWTVNVGYGRTEIADAVRDQLVTMNYFAQTAGNIPAAQFAERLLEKMPGMSRVYYSNSGSEANEKAFKMVRQIAAKKYGGKKHKILYRERDYHGTTISCLSATGQFERKHQYGPFTPGFVEVPHCCEYRSQWGEVDDYGVRAANEIERIILEEGPDTVGAICLEPITAGGGVIEPPEGYWPRVQEICQQYNVLLHIDEVVCGLGRTGTWFGYQHYGIEPDFVTMAKGVASGYAAISCTVTNDKVFNLLHDDDGDGRMDYFRDISTFGGCTAGPAAALVNLEIIERENLLENVQQQGEYLRQRLLALKDKYPLIGDVRGKGLFMGFELVKDRVSKEPVDESVAMAVAGHCMQNGVIIGRTNRSFADFNNTLCLSPALIATRADIDAIVDAIDNAVCCVSQ
ncbi:aminotransferase class III-fold pyridoxal phosphate-dependent enzyme [Aestuariicella hydrocarbonica]|uniref:Aminotransferase class III-fold pyridoxal phosphate-dependent enzyme n=1 Tax=Pseudomaricurvus hydrocarbonicus TaxID=1470433 RepID=A0A9E5JX63_9GAMM|nr:aminotransferase class III-fold pyridoxal phosphate-dependent enzyme [Aestuariicella hydrocarbonica]NHO66565.1 aminotransferase class III-fold pyridoxal phosphate-dependent enzyme [Aestuariicella hydrocarbonica]